MNDNHRSLIKWAECLTCKKKDAGKIYENFNPQNLATPPEDRLKKLKLTRQEWINMVVRKHGNKSWIFFSRESAFEFMQKHWDCSNKGEKIITREQFDNYWDNDNWRGVWPFGV